MPRCCVPGCDTGTRAEIVRTRKAKARNKSTFLLPADYGLFKKWKKVLEWKYDTEEGKSGRVCELHFDESDIIRHYHKQMEDGSIKQFTFSRPTLKKGTIPLSTPRGEAFQPQKRKNKKNNKQKIVHKPKNGKDNEQSNIRKRKISSESDDEYVPNKKPKKTTIKNDLKDPKNYGKRKNKRPIKVPRNKIISNSVKKSRLPIYNYDKLVHDLNRRNSKLPKGWEFSIPDDDTVKLVFTPESSKYFLTCILKRDTFVEIKAHNARVMVNLEFKFLSHAHFLENLRELEKVQCCKGIICKKFTKRCQGFILLNKTHQPLKNNGRCKLCKKVWDNIIRRQRRPRYVQILKRLVSKTPKKKLNVRKVLKCFKKKLKTGKKF